MLDWFVFKEVTQSSWSARHIARHNVTLEEVREAILERPRYQHRGRNETVIVYGQTSAGRHLLVVLADEGDGMAFVITARDMNLKERRLFQRKAR